MKIKDFLMQSKWRVFNIEFARAVGLNECLVLMELADAENFFSSLQQSDYTGEFFVTYEQISGNTTLSDFQIRNAIKSLRERGIVSTSLKGMPAKQYYRIDLEFLCPLKTEPQEVLKTKGQDPLKTEGLIYKEPINKKPFKKDSTLFSDLKKIFCDEYRALSGQEYYWQPKDAVQLNSIISQLKFAYKAKDIIADDDKLSKGFIHVLQRAKADKWISQNFTVGIISSQFNKLKSIKNGNKQDQLNRYYEKVLRTPDGPADQGA